MQMFEYRRLALTYRFFLMTLLVGADVLMFRYLIDGLTHDSIAPAVAALIGGLITGISTALGLGARDFFQAEKDGD